MISITDVFDKYFREPQLLLLILFFIYLNSKQNYQNYFYIYKKLKASHIIIY